jgi:transcriptional regulator with XRE-family HTH domain
MVSGRKPDRERRRQVTEMRTQGLSMAEIGRRLGISRQAVYSTLRSIQNPTRRVVLCRKCKLPFDPVGVLAKDANKTLCLICLAREPAPTFGQRLKAFRLAIGLTRMDLARLAGISPPMIQHYEEDKHFPNRASRLKLATALGVTLEVLGMGRPLKEKPPRVGPRKKAPAKAVGSGR